MGRLTDLIDDLRAKQGGRSEASIAREVGVRPQVINSWRNRGMKELPDKETLRKLALVLGVSDQVVFHAAGVDTGYIRETVVTDEELVRRRVAETRAAIAQEIPDADTGSA